MLSRARLRGAKERLAQLHAVPRFEHPADDCRAYARIGGGFSGTCPQNFCQHAVSGNHSTEIRREAAGGVEERQIGPEWWGCGRAVGRRRRGCPPSGRLRRGQDGWEEVARPGGPWGAPGRAYAQQHGATAQQGTLRRCGWCWRVPMVFVMLVCRPVALPGEGSLWLVKGCSLRHFGRTVRS